MYNTKLEAVRGAGELPARGLPEDSATAGPVGAGASTGVRTRTVRRAAVGLFTSCHLAEKDR